MNIRSFLTMLLLAFLVSVFTAAQSSQPITVQLSLLYRTAAIAQNSTGVLPVAILSSSTFDARTVDPRTLGLIAPNLKLIATVQNSPCHERDTNDDGLLDLICIFKAKPSIAGDSVAVLKGKSVDGIPIRGEVALHIVPTK